MQLKCIWSDLFKISRILNLHIALVNQSNCCIYARLHAAGFVASKQLDLNPADYQIWVSMQEWVLSDGHLQRSCTETAAHSSLVQS